MVDTKTKNKAKKKVNMAIVMPVYEDRDAVRELFKHLKSNIDQDFIVFAIEDGSVRAPLSSHDFEQAGIDGVLINLKRNMGHQRAIAAGLIYLNTHFSPKQTVVMDSDGEDKPSSIPEMLALLTDNETDVVVASRKSRHETLQFKLFYILYRMVFKALTGKPVGFGNFMALSPKGLSRITAMNELWLHLAGTAILSRLRLTDLPLDRGKRYNGRSKMNFSGLVLHGMRAVMVFAEDVLVRVGILCFTLMMGTLAAIILAVILKSIGMASPGWFSTAIGLLFIILIQTGFLNLLLLLISGSNKSRAPLPAIELAPLIDHVDMIKV